MCVTRRVRASHAQVQRRLVPPLVSFGRAYITGSRVTRLRSPPTGCPAHKLQAARYAADVQASGGGSRRLQQMTLDRGARVAQASRAQALRGRNRSGSIAEVKARDLRSDVSCGFSIGGLTLDKVKLHR